MLEFLEAPSIVLHFSYYTLMIFLMMLIVILLSVLMTLISILSDQALDLWQQLELASELESDLQDMVGWGRKWLVDFNAGKTWFCLTSLMTLVLLMWKWMSLLSKKNNRLRCWGWLSLWNWIGAPTLSLLLKLSPRKLEPLFILWSVCHLHGLLLLDWGGSPSCYLKLLDKLQKWIISIVGLSLAAFLEHLAHCQKSLFYRYYFGKCSSELAQLVPRSYSGGRSTLYSDRLHDFFIIISRCHREVYVNSFFPHKARLEFSCYRILSFDLWFKWLLNLELTDTYLL